ncbi:MAG: marine proteobacterial sortase target protein [Desulforhopalus sp.]
MKKQNTKTDSRKKIGSIDPGSLLLIFYIAMIAGLLLLGGVTNGNSGETIKEMPLNPEEVVRGELLVPGEGGGFHPAPLMNQEVNMKVSGITARVTVKQRFQNPGREWIEALYVFPLPDESAVDHLRMQVGERLIEGKIMEKEAARQSHEKAKNEGRKSSLLVQNRPNIFTTKVANIGPGEEVTVELEYQQTVRFDSGVFSLRFPMVVGPRYIPGAPSSGREGNVNFNTTGWGADTDQVPDGSEITPPVDLAGRSPIPVAMHIDLAAGFTLGSLQSLYHGIESEKIGKGHHTIRLTGEIKADRDFVLEWQPENQQEVQAALFAEDFGSSQYMLLMLMVPESPPAERIPREVIFILDVSGSMAGSSIIEAKAAIDMALDSLQPEDRFNIITFSNNVHSLYPQAKPADGNHVQEAHRFIGNVAASGGTEMKPALKMALDGSHRHERLRQVIFLTDGAVGNEDELLKIIDRRLGDSRLFTVGIGSAPNSYFMSRAAAMGRGTFTYIGMNSEVQQKMTELFAKLERPVLADLKLNLPASGEDIEIYPSPLPDLYAGEPLMLAVKTSWENAVLEISGIRLGKPWNTSVDTATHGNRDGIAALWARKKIRSQMEDLALGGKAEQIRKVVMETALEHHLVSKYTSLVAVDSEVSRPGGEQAVQAAVKTHLPHGWQAAAVFGGAARTATPADLRLLAGGILLLLAMLIFGAGRFAWQRKF